MIKHLRCREEQLTPFGWRSDHAEWVALVCLHSGIFTRAQFCAHFGNSDGPAWRSIAQRFVESLLSRKLAVEEDLDGLPTTTRTCRISNKKIYRALGIPNVRHRRTAGAGLLMRRLLSLDYVLEHPKQGWLPTEPEKVAALEGLQIPKKLFPRRRYAGDAAHVRRYFALKFPIALDPEVATFVYVDPGRDTDKELLSWGRAHAPLWAALREKGHPVHVVAVARDWTRQGRARKVLKRWTRPGDDHGSSGPQGLSPEEEQELAILEQAIDQADFSKFDPYGGFHQGMNYRQMLLDRPQAAPRSTSRRIRIDQGKTWLSPRFPVEGEL